MPSSRKARFAVLLAGVFVAGYFVYHARLSLRAEFTYDDLMNCWRAVFDPLATHLRDCVVFFRPSASYRPFPALVYRAAFAWCGFDLFPLRLLLLVVMGLGVLLTYSFGRLLSSSREVGLLAALFGAYNFHLSSLQFNTGFVYDIFCFFFYFSALVLYLRVRASGRLLRWYELLGFSALYVLALDSKELAVSLAVVIAAWELLFHSPQRRLGAVLRWQYRELLPAWITVIMTAAFIGGRVLASRGLSGMEGYTPAFHPAVYLRNVGHFLDELFYANSFFDGPKTLTFMLLLLAGALVSRSRGLLACWILYFVGVLPIAFIDGRALAAAWLPTTGLLVYGAILAVSLRDMLFTLPRFTPWRTVGQVGLFALAAGFMLRVHGDNIVAYKAWKPEYTHIREVRESFLRLCPAMKPRSSVLIVTDPLNGTFATVFLINLLYRDSSIAIHQLFRFAEPPSCAEVAGFTYVFDTVDGKLVRLDPAEFASRLTTKTPRHQDQ